MVQSLSKKFIAGIAAFICFSLCQAQDLGGESDRSKEYKDARQHENFRKRRLQVGAWQINKLKQGALVVRLKTNKMAIDELSRAGNKEDALQKQLETFAINKNTMFAFKENYNFSKVYFIPSHFSDSLLNGARGGIFLDTNLNIDPAIRMEEDFYLLAERDYGYNSSIGFVPEDSARLVLERGNAVKQMAFVIKNKYGHQLKNPFPYSVGERPLQNALFDFPVTVTPGQGEGIQVNYQINRRYLEELEEQKRTSKATARRPSGTHTVKLEKHFLYEPLSRAVQELNSNLLQYHQQTPAPTEHQLTGDIKPFLY